MEQIRASVAMAVYNGERYLRPQLDSILCQLGPRDELVISCDPSTDKTAEIAKEYAAADFRVRVICNPRPGLQRNFTNAVSSCRGEFVFLSDQDDVWHPEKLESVLGAFEGTGADLVVHDASFADAELRPTGKTVFEAYGTYNNPFFNIVRCNFWGCCMAFRRDFGEKVCPFPDGLGHDLWLGVLAGFHGKIVRVNSDLLTHRLHGANATMHRRSLGVIAVHRLRLICKLLSFEAARLFGRKGA